MGIKFTSSQWKRWMCSTRCVKEIKKYSQNMRQPMNIKKAWSTLAWRTVTVEWRSSNAISDTPLSEAISPSSFCLNSGDEGTQESTFIKVRNSQMTTRTRAKQEPVPSRRLQLSSLRPIHVFIWDVLLFLHVMSRWPHVIATALHIDFDWE